MPEVQEGPETPCVQETPDDRSSEESDVEEVEQEPVAVGNQESEPGEPVELRPGANQPPGVLARQEPVAVDEIGQDLPVDDERVLRDRGRLRRPARFVD